MLLLSSADFSKLILSGMPSECQTVWIQIRTNQTVRKGYQQSPSRQTVNSLLTFFKINFFKKNLSLSDSLDPDQDRHSVSPDLGPNCLQRLSTDDKSGHWQVTASGKFCHLLNVRPDMDPN